MIRRFLSLLLLTGLLAGCGAAAAPSGAARLTPRELFPSALDTVWSYDIDAGVGEPPVLGALRVDSVSGDSFVLANNGEDPPKHYEWRDGDLYHVDAQGWLLRAPIEVGAQWDAPGGRRAEITSLEARVETASGNYAGCVEVQETGGEDGRVLQTIYCPEVGMAKQRVVLEMSSERASVDVTLRAFILGE